MNSNRCFEESYFLNCFHQLLHYYWCEAEDLLSYYAMIPFQNQLELIAPQPPHVIDSVQGLPFFRQPSDHLQLRDATLDDIEDGHTPLCSARIPLPVIHLLSFLIRCGIPLYLSRFVFSSVILGHKKSGFGGFMNTLWLWSLRNHSFYM